MSHLHFWSVPAHAVCKRYRDGPLLNPHKDRGEALTVVQRYRGPEGAGPDAPMFADLGILGSSGLVMQDLDPNPPDLSEGGKQKWHPQLGGVRQDNLPALVRLLEDE